MRYNKRSMSVTGELSGKRKNHAREKDKGKNLVTREACCQISTIPLIQFIKR
jgi:hypothetical protein